MTTVYKLTDKNGYTRKGYSNELKWGEGVTHKVTGKGGLCSEGCIHAYVSPELAVLLNPIHANIPSPLMFKGEMDITHRDNGDLKVGGKSFTTTKQMKPPEISTRQRVIFALLCADEALELTTAHMPPKALEKLAEWRRWRDDYISGKTSASSAASAAEVAAEVARTVCAAAAAAAYAAAAAAYAAAEIARTVYAAAASAAYAAEVARTAHVARTAADAAEAAAARIDLAEIARRAIKLGK
jgi:hypothetical protein